MEMHSPTFTQLLREKLPNAIAWIRGNETHPTLSGIVRFYAIPIGGILVNAEVSGLLDSSFYAMHIHEFGNCTPPFDQTGVHYNPEGLPHPAHSGDMPPLLATNGFAWLAFYDGRLSLEEILNKSLVIHANRDDFTSQPAGDSGEKIGCGVIKQIYY